MERRYAKIIVKNNYESENDLVFRPLVRAYNLIGSKTLIENGNALILGVIIDNKFYELFTKKEINCDFYEDMSLLDVYYKVAAITKEESDNLHEVYNTLLFGEKSNISDNISTIEDLAMDRAIEFKAYNDGLTNHNVYSEPFNGYNDFNFKLENLNKTKKIVRK